MFWYRLICVYVWRVYVGQQHHAASFPFSSIRNQQLLDLCFHDYIIVVVVTYLWRFWPFYVATWTHPDRRTWPTRLKWQNIGHVFVVLFQVNQHILKHFHTHTHMHTQIQREREKNSIYTTYTLINMQPSTNTYKHLIHLTHRHTHTHTCLYIYISVIILLSSLILNGLCVVFADGPLQNNINHFIGFCIFSIKSYNNFHNSMTQLGSNRFLSNSSAWKVYGKLNVIQTSTVINKKIINI